MFKTFRVFVVLTVFLLASSAQAQTPTPQNTPTPLPVFALGAGSTVEGNINDAVPSVRYSFEADASASISVRMETTSGDLDPFLTLFGPNGELIEQDDDSGGGRNAAITLTVPRAGTYVIEAARFQQAGARSSGTFRLALNIAGVETGGGTTNPLATMPDFGVTPNPRVIAYQDSDTGTVDDANPQGYFALRGSQGDLVRVIMTTTSGDLSPRLSVLNRSLVAISSEVQTRQTESIAYVTLPEPGWYLISAAGRSGAGTYDLYVDRLVAGAVLAYDDAVVGNLSPSTPTISYIFNAHIDDLIAANLFTIENTGVVPELRLLDVSFNSVARATGDRFATLRASIPRSGTYILQVNNLRPETTGGFNLRLTGTPVDVSKLPMRTVNYNERYRGFVNSDSPISFYRFSGKADERVTIQMSTTSGNLDPYLILTDDDLNELTFNDNVSNTRNARIVQFALPKDGDYLILATRAGLAAGATGGGFDLALTVGELALTSGAVTATLTWNTPADLNLFVRDPSGRIVSWSNPVVPSGGTLQIDSNTNCNTPTDQPVEHIFWAGEQPPAGDYEIWAWYQNTCGRDTAVPFNLMVEVQDQMILQTLDSTPALRPGQRFQASIRVADDGSAFIIDRGRVTTPTPQQTASEGGDRLMVYGDTLTGTIDNRVYALFYQFVGEQGDHVTIAARTLSGDLDPVLVLRDADDRNLPAGMNDDADSTTKDARLTYTLPADGQYVIAVTRFGVRDGTTTGTFRLSLEKAEMP